MDVKELSLPGAYLITPQLFPDARGISFEALRMDLLGETIGRPFDVAQVNFSVSHRNTVRGLHGVTTAPGQTKYVTCVRGAARDVLVDLRVGSPTFRRHESRELTPDEGIGVYIPDGVLHGFAALTDDTCLCYLLSTAYVPGRQITVDPWDPGLGLPWPMSRAEAIMSGQDSAAPGVDEAGRAGLLPRYEDVR